MPGTFVRECVLMLVEWANSRGIGSFTDRICLAVEGPGENTAARSLESDIHRYHRDESAIRPLSELSEDRSDYYAGLRERIEGEAMIVSLDLGGHQLWVAQLSTISFECSLCIS